MWAVSALYFVVLLKYEVISPTQQQQWHGPTSGGLGANGVGQSPWATQSTLWGLEGVGFHGVWGMEQVVGGI